MTRSTLRRHITGLSPKGSVTRSVERALVTGRPRAPARPNQKDQWLRWLSGYRPGYYGRVNWDRPPKFIYNHLESVLMLLWLAEAAGVPRFALMKAKAAVLKAGSNDASQAAALRRILPWCLVEALLNAR